jgi:hypothetical protein
MAALPLARRQRRIQPIARRQVGRRSAPILLGRFVRLRVVLVAVQRALGANRVTAQVEVDQATGVLPGLPLLDGPRLAALGSGMVIGAPLDGHLPMDRGARLSR